MSLLDISGSTPLILMKAGLGPLFVLKSSSKSASKPSFMDKCQKDHLVGAATLNRKTMLILKEVTELNERSIRSIL